MTKYLILVEGIADIIFLRDYLISLDTNLQIKTEKIKKEFILISDSREIKINVIDGYTNIQLNKKMIQTHIDDDFKILVIQDADNPDKKNGGVQNRMEYLDEQKDTLLIQFETFLFPNHEDNGDLETLLLQIKKEEKYNPSQGCYQSYIECTKKIDSQYSNELEEDKSQVFNYFRTYYGMENSKEQNRKYESDYWDFESEALSALKDFFEKNLFMDASDIG